MDLASAIIRAPRVLALACWAGKSQCRVGSARGQTWPRGQSGAGAAWPRSGLWARGSGSVERLPAHCECDRLLGARPSLSDAGAGLSELAAGDAHPMPYAISHHGRGETSRPKPKPRPRPTPGRPGTPRARCGPRPACGLGLRSVCVCSMLNVRGALARPSRRLRAGRT